MHRFFTLMATLLIVAAASAGDKRVEAYKFMFDGANGPVEVELNSDTMGFGLQELAPGDVRTTVTEDGSSITISRLDETFSLATDGEVFEIPARHGPPSAGHREIMMMHHGDGKHPVLAHRRASPDGLMIVSSEPLDETTRATIRDALSAAGIVQDIDFVAPGPAGENVTIDEEIDADGARVIIKRVIED
ncbi:MAG: hypothetical protein KJO54_04685 [Gammaproteobacteria bacterium]|nr:hypothetical protein [Gammaproteobacteria bacterium]NNF60677.1 hypothetical protein [Gammaproteobacteria bacterium]